MAAVTIRTRAPATVALLVLAGQVDAGRPLVTDDAYPVEQGRVEVEFGLELETSTNSYSLTAPFAFDIQGRLGIRYLVVEDLIMDAAIGRSFTSRPPVEFFATVRLTWTFDAPGNAAPANSFKEESDASSEALV